MAERIRSLSGPFRRSRRVAARVAALAVALALAGCMVGPDYQRPALELPAGTAGVPRIADDWWRSFNDPVLDGFEAEALAHNLDLAEAVARIDEARASLRGARGQQLPDATVGVNQSRSRISGVGSTPLPAGTPLTSSDRRVSLDLSWEIDLWGRLARGTEAARAELAASEAARDGVRLSLTATVARSLFEARALAAQLDITRQTVTSRRQTAGLQQKRFRAGSVSELEASQAEAEAADAAARLPDLEQQLAAARNALAVLLGRTPQALVERPVGDLGGEEKLPPLPSVPAALPSDLLERRPDVRSAEQQLVAANARIGAAKADYFPRLTLTGSYGAESQALSDLFTGPANTWSLAAGLVQPLFTGGRIAANVEGAEARTAQAEIAYRRTVQAAFRETLDALVAHRSASERLRAREERETALARSLKLANRRYEAGYSSWLDVLDAERGLFQARLDRVEARRVRLDAAIGVIEAMGGGWTVPGKTES
ncbi:MAG TPA: efflux transporter outer membrane subunit [Plasticicumulans sp.]|nr:efflux transporter outer membrane subunit [Plasticicumulans sp.]